MTTPITPERARELQALLEITPAILDTMRKIDVESIRSFALGEMMALGEHASGPLGARASETRRLCEAWPVVLAALAASNARVVELRMSVERAEQQMRDASNHALVSREAGSAFLACADDLKAILDAAAPEPKETTT